MCGSFGSGGFGSGPFGSGFDSLFLSVMQTTLNAIRVAFEDGAVVEDPLQVDPLDVSAWSILRIEPMVEGSVLPLIQVVIRESSSVAVVYTDAPLTPGQGYELVYAGDGACESTLAFIAFAPGNRSVAGEQTARGRFDLANPSYEADAAGNVTALGTLQVDSTGDFANETGVPYLRKRIVRRLTTLLGGFTFLPDYGLGLEVGKILRPSSQFRLRALAERQIREEPDVQQAAVSLTQPRPGVVIFSVKIVTSTGAVDQFDEQMTIGG